VTGDANPVLIEPNLDAIVEALHPVAEAE